MSLQAAFWLQLYLETTVCDLWKANFVPIQGLRKSFFVTNKMQLWSTGKWMLRMENTSSSSLPNLTHGSQPLWALRGFQDEQVTRCKPPSAVRRIFSHFSCSCQMFKNPPSFRYQVVKMSYKTVPPGVFWKEQSFFKKTEEKHSPIFYWTLQNFEETKENRSKVRKWKWTQLRRMRTTLSFMFLLLRNIGPVNDLTHIPPKFKTPQNWGGEEMFCTSATEKKKIYK